MAIKRDQRAYYMQKLMDISSKQIHELHTVVQPKDIYYVVQSYGFSDQEHFICIYLNSAHQLIGTRVITKGLLGRTLCHPREVFRPGIEMAAHAVALAHNHPSNDVSPSREDEDMTTRLIQAGKIIGIEVLDHIVFGRTGFLSLRESTNLFS